MTPRRQRSGRIRHLAPGCLALVAAAALSACGGSSKPHTATSATPGGSISGPQSLVDHLPPVAQLPGLHPIEQPNVIDSPGVWTASGGLPGTLGAANAQRLSHLGFVAGLRQVLGSNATTPAQVSVEVEQFQKPAGADSELKYRFAQAKATGHTPGYTFGPLHVHGVPGAIGYSINQPGTGGDAVTFVVGPYFYSIQSVVPTGSAPTITAQQMKGEAAAWYQNVKAL